MPTKKQIKKKPVSKKKAAKRNPKKRASAKAASKPASKKSLAKKTLRGKAARRSKKPPRGKNQAVDVVTFEPSGLGSRSAGQSGDLQGLSNRRRASSESVNELLEEGNAFEADIVKGVEDAGDADESEVRTHEVPEDDVPGEYREGDK